MKTLWWLQGFYWYTKAHRQYFIPLKSALTNFNDMPVRVCFRKCRRRVVIEKLRRKENTVSIDATLKQENRTGLLRLCINSIIELNNTAAAAVTGREVNHSLGVSCQDHITTAVCV